MEGASVTLGETLEATRAVGVDFYLDGDDLVLEADAPPAPALLRGLAQVKSELVDLLVERAAIQAEPVLPASGTPRGSDRRRGLTRTQCHRPAVGAPAATVCAGGEGEMPQKGGCAGRATHQLLALQ
jgi:hypothetical protein